MATAVVMPNAGNSVESCVISKWHKKKGEAVQKGDILFTYETDKATFEEEASEEGILLDIFFDEDDDVAVLLNVCVIGKEGESTKEFNPSISEEIKEEAKEIIKEPIDQSVPIDENKVIIQDGEKIKISPRAKKKSEKLGIDYRFASPTGPYGRIIERDVDSLYENGPVTTMAAKNEYLNGIDKCILGTGIGGRITVKDLEKKPVENVLETQATEFEDVKLTNIRKVIAKSMHKSLSEAAQLTLNASFDATEILEYRKKIKTNMEKMEISNITLNDIILYAVSRVLLRHKELNAHFLDDKIRIFNNVNLGVAVDTHRGLLVPTIFNADKKSLNEMSIETKNLATQSQEGSINPDYLKGGSFTVTNLGSLGIESFTPVINPPQTAILGVCNILERCRKKADGTIECYKAMGFSLTFDHRAVDGAPAARFLKDLIVSLENFTTMLVK